MDVVVFSQGPQSEALLSGLETLLGACLAEEKYVTHRVTEEELDQGAWKDTAALVCLVSVENLTEGVRSTLNSYITLGGRVLALECPAVFNGVSASEVDSISETSVHLGPLGLDDHLLNRKGDTSLLHFTSTDGGTLEVLATYKSSGKAAAVRLTHVQGSLIFLGFPLLSEETGAAAGEMSSTATRVAILSSVLRRAGVACAERPLSLSGPFLKPGYLVSDAEVWTA